MFNKIISVIISVVMLLYMLFTIKAFREIDTPTYVIVGLCIMIILLVVGLLIQAFN